MDTVRPRRPAEERPDVRLSATGAGQGALLEAATVSLDRGSRGAPVVVHSRFGYAAAQLQPQVLPDGLFVEKRTGGLRLRAIRAATAATATQEARRPGGGRRPPAPVAALPGHSQGAVAHAHAAAAVPAARVAGLRHLGRYRRLGRDPVDGRGRLGGREQAAAHRQGSAARPVAAAAAGRRRRSRPARVPFGRHQGAVGERGGPDHGDDRRHDHHCRRGWH